MSVVNAARKNKTVASPNAIYETLKPLWNKSRALCSGERFVKDYDGLLDVRMFTNLLIPFSPSMSQAQYNFYRAEAELPGIVAQFAKMLVSGLLRKQPSLSLPDDAPEDAEDWIINEFGQDDSPLTAFMDKALFEEIQTNHTWIHIDFPRVLNYEDLTREEQAALKPYPILWDAESVINWRVGVDANGKNMLTRIIKRGFVEEYDKGEYEFHPRYIERIWVHELDEKGEYQIRIFDRPDDANEIPIVSGKEFKNPKEGPIFELKETITNMIANGERLKMIPVWPMNGSYEPSEPMLMPVIDKEVALYNKVSRRNHLLYGAATFTPYVASDMEDKDFQDIVDSGLGTWIHVGKGESLGVLDTPTDALKDMESAIASAIEEMAKMGIRMLAPENGQDQSGIALEIRNAAQTAQLGTFNSKVSNVLAQIIAFMLNWKYDLEYKSSNIAFSLSEDFNPIPLGADWLRLATEWYESGLIPRSIWLLILKQNDMIPPDYDDDDGQKEINEDEIIVSEQDNMEFAAKLQQQQKQPK